MNALEINNCRFYRYTCMTEGYKATIYKKTNVVNSKTQVEKKVEYDFASNYLLEVEFRRYQWS